MGSKLSGNLDRHTDAGWFFSYKDIPPDSTSAILLAFAESIYPPTANDNLELHQRSTIQDGKYERFHDNVRRSMVRFFYNTGKEAKASPAISSWARKEFPQEADHTIKMCLYLSLVLRLFAYKDDTIPQDQGLRWFAARHHAVSVS